MSERTRRSSSSLLEYIKSVPSSALLHLYGDETRGLYVCRAILQQLSLVAQQVVLRLSCCGGAFSKAGVLIWTKQHMDCLEELQSWSIVGDINGATVALTTEFHQGLKALLEAADSSSPWTPVTETQLQALAKADPNKKFPTLEDLERYTNNCWNTVLHFLVGTKHYEDPPQNVVSFLLLTKLMQTDPEFSGNADDAPLVITNRGYDFMLQEGPQQVWHFCQQYLKSLEGHKKHKEILKEALLFLISLSFARVGDAYPASALSKDARILMKDLALFGLLYVHKVGKTTIFYPTHVATQLLQGNAAASGNNATATKALEQDLQNSNPKSKESSSHLAIIVQTNFQVCAYTTSELHVSMLGLFCDVQTIRRLPNVVFMSLTRDSIKGAFALGVTAQQILKFLEKHAHPKLLRSGDEVVPSNVQDQIWLWDRERSRVKWTQVYCHTCLLENEFDAVKQYAMDINAHEWSSDKRRNEVFVKYSQAERVLEFVRRWRAKTTAERG